MFLRQSISSIPTEYKRKQQFQNVKMLKCSKLARSHTQCLYFVIILSIQRYAISNRRELHCVRADVFGDLKIYVSEALARFARPRIKISYLFLSVYLGVLPPPPIPKSWLRQCIYVHTPPPLPPNLGSSSKTHIHVSRHIALVLLYSFTQNYPENLPNF